MPNATTDTTPKRFDLKSLPGAYVVIRPISYGEYLRRRDKAMQMTADMKNNTANRVDVNLMQEVVTRYEWEIMIVDHNLEDSSGRKLNFGTVEDFSRVSPPVGEEVTGYISEFTDWEKSDQATKSGDTAGDNVSQITAAGVGN